MRWYEVILVTHTYRISLSPPSSMETDVAFIAGIAAGGGALLLIVVVSVMVLIRRHRRNVQDKHAAVECDDEFEAEINGHKRVENPVFDDRSNTPAPPSPVPSNSGYSPLPSMPPTMSTSPTTFSPLKVEPPLVEAEESSASTDDRAARLKAMREGRQKRRDDEWLLVHQALALIDSLPDENT